MLLKSISLNNFRQFEELELFFSDNPEKNVTLVFGNNGAGKTTLAQAFFWCLYDETKFQDSVLNKAVAQKLKEGGQTQVEVKLVLIHRGVEYEIKRIQKFEKKRDRPTPLKSEVKISVKEKNGETHYLRQGDLNETISEIMPKELSHYFFFNGAGITKMSEDIMGKKKSNEFKKAVNGLTGLQTNLNAIEHLGSVTQRKSVLGFFNNELKGSSDEELTEATNLVENTQKELEHDTSRLEEIKIQINKEEAEKKEYELEIKKYEGSKELQERKERLEDEVANNSELINHQLKSFVTIFQNGIFPFIGSSLVNRVLDEIQDIDFKESDNIPDITVRTIEYLLDRGKCICGNELTLDSETYKLLENLKEYIPPNSTGSSISEFLKETRNKYSNAQNLSSIEEENLETIGRIQDKIDENTEEIERISNELGSGNMIGRVNDLNNRIRNLDKSILQDNVEKKQLEDKLKELQVQLKKAETERNSLAALNEENRKTERCLKYANYIIDALKDRYNKKEIETRERLEELVNKVFKSIYDGDLSLKINEDYKINAYEEKYHQNEIEISTAQSLAVVFAFIGAVITLAKENSEKDNTYSEPYPLVMDAPLSAFDKIRIKAISEVLPEVAEQVIIFIKDVDGEVLEEYLKDKIGDRYYLKKRDELITEIERIT